MDTATRLVITAIVAITILEGLAILRGVDGTTLSASVAAIAALAGAKIGHALAKPNEGGGGKP